MNTSSSTTSTATPQPPSAIFVRLPLKPSTSQTHPATPPPSQPSFILPPDDATSIWWPAFLYENFTQLQLTLTNPALKCKVFRERTTRKDNRIHLPTSKIALLLGRPNSAPGGRLTVGVDDEGCDTRNFYDCIMEVLQEDERVRCNGFRDACDDAFTRMEGWNLDEGEQPVVYGDISNDVGQEMAIVPYGQKNADAPVSTPTAMPAPQSYAATTDAPREEVGPARSSTTIVSSDSLSRPLHTSQPPKSDSKKSAVMDLEEPTQKSTPHKNTKKKQAIVTWGGKNQNMSPLSVDMPAEESSEETNPQEEDAKTPMIPEEEEDEWKIDHPILPDDSWKTVFDKLKIMGWTYTTGKGTIAWFYVHPRMANKKKNELLKEGICGQDYLTSDEALKRYCKKEYGWLGEDVAPSPASTKSGVQLADRVKKRVGKRQAKKKELDVIEEDESLYSGSGEGSDDVEEVSVPRDSVDSDLTENTIHTEEEDEVDEDKDEEMEEPEEEDNLINDDSTAESKSVSKDSTISERMKKRRRSSTTPRPPLHPKTKKRKLEKKPVSNTVSKRGRKITHTPKAQPKTPTPQKGVQLAAATPDVSVATTYHVLRNVEAWRLLMNKFSFSYVNGKYYCYPSVKPGGTDEEGNEFKEGRDYFSNLVDLRRHLCAYGLPTSKKKMGEQEMYDLSAWVKYANVGALRQEPAVVQDFEGLSDGQWWIMAQKLGFRYSNGRYVFPGIPLKKKFRAQCERDFFESRGAFWEYLARFGMPRYAEKWAEGREGIGLDEKDRFLFDMYLTSCPDISAFKRNRPPYDVVENGLFSAEHAQATIVANAAAGAPTPSNSSTNPTSSSGAAEEKGVSKGQSSNERIHNQDQPVVEEESDKKNVQTSSTETAPNEEEIDSPVKNMIEENSETSVDEAAGDKHLPSDSTEGSAEVAGSDKEQDKDGIQDLGTANQSQKDVYLPTTENSEIAEMETSMVHETDQSSVYHSMHEDENMGGNQNEGAPLMTQPCDDLHISSDISNPGLITGENLSFMSLLDDAAKEDGMSDSSSKSEKQAGGGNTVDLSQPATRLDVKSSDQCSHSDALSNASPKILHAVRCNEKLNGVPVQGSDVKGTSVQRDDDWVTVKGKMMDSGWEWHAGRGLHTELFVLPGGDRINGVEGEDYVVSEFAMKKFAYDNLKWGGDDAFLKELESEGRRSRRQRGTAIEKQSEQNSERKQVQQKEKREQAPPVSEVVVKNKSKVHGKKKEEKRIASVPLPDKEITVESKLKCCIQVLSPSYDKKDISHGSRNSSRLAPAVAEVRLFLENAIKTWGAQGKMDPNASSLYVCGGPGTGKTSTVHCLSREIKHWCIQHRAEILQEKSDNRWEVQPNFCFVNVAHIQKTDSTGASNEILRRIAKSLNIESRPQEENIKKRLHALGTRNNKRVLFLVLDEVDMLLSTWGGEAEGEKLLKTLSKWSEDHFCMFALIGISNSVDDKRARSLADLGIISKTVVFPAYREEDLIAILEDRVGSKIIDPAALKLVSRKVAATSGDARLALQLTSEAVSQSLKSCSDEVLNSEVIDGNGPIVKIPHMMRAVREGTGMKHSDLISGLPLAAKVVLCVAMALSQVSKEWEVFTLGSLKTYCAEATQHGLVDHLGTDQLYELVGQLTDAGLLLTGRNDPWEELDQHVYMDTYKMPLRLGVQLDDVEFAIEKTLSQDKFYSKMMDYVRKNNRQNRDNI